jgi:zinc transporter ZupT
MRACSDEFCGTERLAGEICPRGYGATTGFFFLGLALTAVLNVLTSTASLEFLCGKCGFVFRVASDNSRPAQPRGDSDSCAEPGEGESSKAGSSQQPETQPLPPGWEVRLAIGSMKPFFYHPVSKEFSWGFPGLKGGAHCPCDDPVDTQDVEMCVAQAERESLRRVDDNGMPIEAPEPHLNKDLERNHPEVEDQAKLNATGLLTGLAIAIHNFPEGLATFVAAMADPSLGAAIAVAIAIHNIPEVKIV